MSDAAGASLSVLPAAGEVQIEAPTSESLPVCDAVPAGEAVAKNVLASDAEVQLSGSSTTPVRVVDAEPAPESMPPPAKRSIVVGLSAPSAALAVVPKSRKRLSANPDAAKKGKCVEAGPLPTRVSGSGSGSLFLNTYESIFFLSPLLSFSSSC